MTILPQAVSETALLRAEIARLNILVGELKARTAASDAALCESAAVNSALRESEARFRSLAGQSLVGIAIIEEGRFTYVNEFLISGCGYSREELLAMPPLDLVLPEDRSLVAGQLRQRLSGQADQALYTFRILRKDGAVRDMECHASLMRIDGQPAVISTLLDITERSQASRDLHQLQEELRRQALHDPLTGLYNRFALSDFFDREVDRARRTRQPLTVVMADIDRFKGINDTVGHAGGDQVLRAFSASLKAAGRSGDFYCRYGGEEFLILLPGAQHEAALRLTEQVRGVIEATPVVAGARSLRITASFGVATFPRHGRVPDELIAAADSALYEAKRGGRNQVRSCDTGYADDFAGSGMAALSQVVSG